MVAIIAESSTQIIGQLTAFSVFHGICKGVAETGSNISCISIRVDGSVSRALGAQACGEFLALVGPRETIWESNIVGNRGTDALP